MPENIREVMNSECSHIKIDSSLVKKIHRYNSAFVNRNEDHVHFFGGNLLGVYPVRFRTTDRIEWYDEVLSINEDPIYERIIKLPTVNEEWVRGTDVMNLTCVWLTHKFYNTTMSHKDKEQAMVDVLMTFHFKLITSIMAHYFKYPADESVALATYAALSKKFALKQYGSWYGMLEARCRDIIDPKSIHYRTIQKFDDDAAVQYMITDIQGRLRGIVKKLYVVFDQVRAQDAKIMTMGGMVELDGKAVVRDMARNYNPYKRYLHEIVTDRVRFIKPELVGVVANAMHTMPEKLLGDSLEYVSANAAKDKHIDEMLDEILLHAFDYLHHDHSAFARTNDITSVITALRGVYMSSRSTDPALMKMRKLAEDVVKKSAKTKNDSVIASVRTGLCLYCVLRTLSMKHYG